ncbi:MAG: hypothetical protein MZV64_23650 [Ignavibacteriales bacterium]|nr:hypothetical protein [Ignavibacteriales bacterium]
MAGTGSTSIAALRAGRNILRHRVESQIRRDRKTDHRRRTKHCWAKQSKI